MKGLKRVVVFAGFLSASVFAGACGSADGGQEGESGAEMQVAATTSVIQDIAEQIGGERVEVTSIVPVGGSPETFQPSPRDAARISESQIVFENGLGLDDWIEDLVESAGGEGQTVVELTDGLEPIEGEEHGEEEPEGDGAEEGHGEEHAEGDPHFWLDAGYAQVYAEKIRDALVEADPDGAGEYEANAEEYLATLEELDGYIAEQAETIPEENRKLVTTHEAFAYFAEAYGFELEGSIIQNPEAEPSSREVAEVVTMIEGENVPAIFTEPQFNGGLADTIANEADVEVYELYSDTLVEDDSGNTYEAMMRTNIDRLAEGLG